MDQATFATYPSLKGKTVFITGGASGIGFELVRGFAAQGANVGFVDLHESNSQALSDTAVNITHEICDLTNIEALQAALTKLASRLGPATVLVNNAANDDRHNWQDVTPAYWDERLQTNLRHQFFTIQCVAPGMIAAGCGSILNMGSNSWHETGGGLPAYATSQAAEH